MQTNDDGFGDQQTTDIVEKRGLFGDKTEVVQTNDGGFGDQQTTDIVEKRGLFGDKT
jgi:hypothetical protein